MITAILISIIALALTFLLMFDVGRHLYVWQSRIHIGRWKNFNEWSNAIIKRAKIWLRHEPIVPKDDNDRLVILDMIRGNYRHNTIQSWQTAGLILGLTAAGEHIKTKELKKILKTFRNPRNIDCALLAYSLLEISDKSDILSTQIENFCREVQAIISDCKGGAATVPYRKYQPNIRYVDSIGLICPFLIKYGIKTNQSELIELAERQIREYSEFFHPTLHLPPHAFDNNRQLPMGVYDWGRGMGWYILGIVEGRRALENVKNSYPDFYNFLEEQIVTLAGIIGEFQHTSGGFGMFLTIASGQTESSATVVSGLLLIEAFILTGKEDYYIRATKAINYLKSATKRNGAIDLCQGDTKGIALYSGKLSVMPFVQGIAILVYERYVKNS